MALKFKITKLEDVPEAVRPLYVKDSDGEGFKLDVEGVVPTEKLAEFRDNNVELKKKLEAFDGIDPKKHKDLLKLEENVKGKELMEAGKLDQLITERTSAMKTEFEGQIKGLTDEKGLLTRQLEGLLIDSAVRAAATESGVLPSAVDDVLLRAKSVFKIDEGKAVPYKDDKIIYGKDGLNPMTVGDWTKNLAASAPHLFVPNKGAQTPQHQQHQQHQQQSQQNMRPVDKISAGFEQRANG